MVVSRYKTCTMYSTYLQNTQMHFYFIYFVGTKCYFRKMVAWCNQVNVVSRWRRGRARRKKRRQNDGCIAVHNVLMYHIVICWVINTPFRLIFNDVGSFFDILGIPLLICVCAHKECQSKNFQKSICCHFFGFTIVFVVTSGPGAIMGLKIACFDFDYLSLCMYEARPKIEINIVVILSLSLYFCLHSAFNNSILYWEIQFSVYCDTHCMTWRNKECLIRLRVLHIELTTVIYKWGDAWWRSQFVHTKKKLNESLSN